MDAPSFLPLLGKPADDPAVKAMLERLGVKQPPRAKRGDTEAYVELSKLGMGLVFEPDAAGRLALHDVQLMAGLASQACTPYAGALPEGLAFDDTRDRVRAKLGAPAEAIEDTRIDIWHRGGHQLVVEYRKEFAGIKLVHLGTPDA